MTHSDLTAGQRALLRERLLLERQALLRALERHQEGASRVQHARDVLLQDADDAPARDADREVDLALTDQEERARAEIDAALERLEDPAFGCCADCGAAIPFDRLLANPRALRCVSCEALHETRHGMAVPKARL